MDDKDRGPRFRLASSAADYEAFGRVCREYVDWCRERYGDMPWFVEAVFGHQSLDDELKAPAARYGPPQGRTMIAVLGDEVVGGGAYQKLPDGACELKRLYLTGRARGRGLGRRLSEMLMAQARNDGFTVMKLDTADRLSEAIAMYESMGFGRIRPYRSYPAPLTPHLIFMETKL